MTKSDEKALSALSKAAARSQLSLNNASEARDHQRALAAAIDGITFRTLQIGLRIGLLRAGDLGDTDRSLALLQTNVLLAAHSPTDLDRREAELYAVRLEAILQSCVALTSLRGLLRLPFDAKVDDIIWKSAFLGGQLAYADVSLSFAVEGRSDPLLGWPSSNGRPRGADPNNWASAALPKIKKWLSDNPDLTESDIYSKLNDSFGGLPVTKGRVLRKLKEWRDNGSIHFREK